jgi:hypothetical protein
MAGTPPHLGPLLDLLPLGRPAVQENRQDHRPERGRGNPAAAGREHRPGRARPARSAAPGRPRSPPGGTGATAAVGAAARRLRRRRRRSFPAGGNRRKRTWLAEPVVCQAVRDIRFRNPTDTPLRRETTAAPRLSWAGSRVGAERLALWQVSRPPLRTRRASFPAPGSPGNGVPPPRLPPALLSPRLWPHRSASMPLTIPGTYRLTRAQGMPLPWRPSPCGRLSRPPTTRTPPTPSRFHRPHCWAPLQDGLPRSRRWTLRGSLGGG